MFFSRPFRHLSYSPGFTSLPLPWGSTSEIRIAKRVEVGLPGIKNFFDLRPVCLCVFFGASGFQVSGRVRSSGESFRLKRAWGPAEEGWISIDTEMLFCNTG